MTDQYIRFCKQCGIPPVKLDEFAFKKALELTMDEERARFASHARNKWSYEKEANNVLVTWYDNALRSLPIWWFLGAATATNHRRWCRSCRSCRSER